MGRSRTIQYSLLALFVTLHLVTCHGKLDEAASDALRDRLLNGVWRK